MTYLKRSSEIKKNRQKKVVILLVVFFVILLGYFARNSTAILVHKVLYPVNKTFEVISSPFTNIPIYFSSKIQLERQNTELEDENRMLKIEALSIKSIKDQNVELKQILNIRDGLNESRIVGEVILTPPFSPYDTFVVRVPEFFNDGSTDVEKIDGEALIGKKVFIKNIMAGEVTEVYDNNAVVRLYSTHSQSLPVRINNEIIAEAKGMGGLSFKIEIPKDIKIEDSAPIYSSAYPENIVGFVEDVITSEASSFQTIYFQYPFKYSDFSFVEIES